VDDSLTEAFDSARGNNDRLFRPAGFDNRQSLQVAFSVGDIDDFALQQIVSMKFIENLSIWFTVIQRDLQRRVSPSTSEIDEHVKVREVPPNNANGSLSINRVWPRSQQSFYYAQKCPRTSEEICAAWPVSTHLVKRS